MLGGRVLLSMVFCPVRDLCHVTFEDFRTRREEIKEGGWSVAGGLRCVVVLFFLEFT